MKTQEQIARNEAENFVMDVTLGVRKLHADDLTPCIESAINEAIQQERERTCEWCLDGHAVLQFFNTGCGVTRVTRHGKHCDNCGGKVLCKEKGEGAGPLQPCEPFKNREGDMCGLCDGTTEHEHAQSKCLFCGMEGLDENMRNHKCKKPTGRQWK